MNFQPPNGFKIAKNTIKINNCWNFINNSEIS